MVGRLIWSGLGYPSSASHKAKIYFYRDKKVSKKKRYIRILRSFYFIFCVRFLFCIYGKMSNRYCPFNIYIFYSFLTWVVDFSHKLQYAFIMGIDSGFIFEVEERSYLLVYFSIDSGSIACKHIFYLLKYKNAHILPP